MVAEEIVQTPNISAGLDLYATKICQQITRQKIFTV